MTHTPHELAEEFPAEIERMKALRDENAHFARICDEYHTVNRAIHRAETLVEPVAEHEEARLRRHRLALKDEISAMLHA